MKTRGIAVVLALLLATVATAAVFLYVRGVRQETKPSADTVSVVVSKVSISPGTSLDPLIQQGNFIFRRFPSDSIVQGAITSLNQLQGRTTAAGILAGEQISLARLQGSSQHTGGVLGIKDGYEAVTVSLAAPNGGGGYVSAGDHITIYAEGSISVILNLIHGTLKDLLKGNATVSTAKANLGDLSFTVIPDVRVLQVLGGNVNSGTGPQGTTSGLQMTLELTPEDAQKLILTQAKASIYVALLPPGQPGVSVPPTNIGDIIQPTKATV